MSEPELLRRVEAFILQAPEHHLAECESKLVCPNSARKLQSTTDTLNPEPETPKPRNPELALETRQKGDSLFLG